MKNTILPVILILAFLAPASGQARGRFSLGPEIGFILQSHLPPSGGSLAWTAGLPFGLAGVYQFDGDLSPIGLDYSVGYSVLSRLTNRGVSIGGGTGTYREDLGVFHWLVGSRYYFRGFQWKPYAGLGFGFEYFRRHNVEFRDQFNTLLPTPIHSNHFNFALVPQGGIEFRPTFRWTVGVGLKIPLSLRSAGVVPAFWIPFTVQVAF